MRRIVVPGPGRVVASWGEINIWLILYATADNAIRDNTRSCGVCILRSLCVSFRRLAASDGVVVSVIVTASRGTRCMSMMGDILPFLPSVRNQLRLCLTANRRRMAQVTTLPRPGPKQLINCQFIQLKSTARHISMAHHVPSRPHRGARLTAPVNR